MREDSVKAAACHVDQTSEQQDVEVAHVLGSGTPPWPAMSLAGSFDAAETTVPDAPEVQGPLQAPAPPTRSRKIAAATITSELDSSAATHGASTQQDASELAARCQAATDPLAASAPGVVANEAAALVLEVGQTSAESTGPRVASPEPAEEIMGTQPAASGVSLLKRRRGLEQDENFPDTRPQEPLLKRRRDHAGLRSS